MLAAATTLLKQPKTLHCVEFIESYRELYFIVLVFHEVVGVN